MSKRRKAAPTDERRAVPRSAAWPGALSGWRWMSLVVAAGVAMVVTVYVLVFANLWYGFYDVSDVGIYLDFAARMANGNRPYIDFPVEYPPLAVPFFTVPGHPIDLWLFTVSGGTGDFFTYAHAFARTMMILGALAGGVTAAAAASLWPDRGRPFAAAAAFALGVAFTGAILANRYDAVVALVLALCLLCLARRWWWAAALVLGLGFALKLTPAILLPLVLILCARPRRMILAGAYFVLAATLPWVPYLVSDKGGATWFWPPTWNWSDLEYVFTYHMERPLQIESVLATPFWIGHLLDRTWVEIGTAYGSQFVAADGAETAASLSGWLLAAALLGVYALIWRRRETLRDDPAAVPLAVFALILAFMTFGKVLSPQYFIWTLPAIALVVVRWRLLGALSLVVLLLTQISFPQHYWQFVEMEKGAVTLIVVRNLVLVAAFVLAVVELVRLPRGSPGDRG